MTINPEPNHLMNEKSPYLLQHANNPVHWFPWSEKAFEKAQQENKPIFLSIGYSTCHWCHVMAHESFEDKEVADILNQHYIAIKVDREERPDIDAVYMKVCQMMTGQGGWPLTIMMTPDKVPFYAGTYFPKDTNYGLPGMTDMLPQLATKYAQDPEHIEEVTSNVKLALQQTVQEKSKHRLEKNLIDTAWKQLKENFDAAFGGFGQAPKFPQPQNIRFLSHFFTRNKDKQALEMAEKTLKQMAKGGIYDHLGFGFARYATDRAWLVPHFEKMLYDNAQLLINYTDAYAITGHAFYKKIGEQIVTFISREMTSVEGAFYSAIDADSEGIEGKYYVWDYEEIVDVLGEKTGEDFTDFYGITPAGNFEGKNIPHLIHHQADFPDSYKWKAAREKLLAIREKRVHPHVDDKVLTSWNAMMIQALAYAGVEFQKEQLVKMAEKGMRFIETHLFQGERLLARYRDGEAKFLGYLDDYAYVIQAYLALYDATYQLGYLQQAKVLTDNMLSLFWDEAQGAFFQTGQDAEHLISREKEIFDGALPSGNSVAASALTTLSALTGELSYRRKVEEMYYSFYEDVHDYPAAAIAFVDNLFHTDFPRKEVVIIGEHNDAVRENMLHAVRKQRNQTISVLVAEKAEAFTKMAPFAAKYKKINGKTTIYVCENFSCHKPTNDWKEAVHFLH